MSRTFAYCRVSTADQTCDNQIQEIESAGFNIDRRRVRATVEKLDTENIRVHCLALGGVDLTSAAGKMTMSVINAVAEFERDLLVERTQAGLKRAKAEGKVLGRPSALSADQQAHVRARRAQGVSLGALATELGVSRSAIHRAEKRAD